MMQEPDTIDIIAKDPDRGKLLLVITEDRPWGKESMHRQFEAKVASYTGYILSEQFADDQPEYAPKDVVIKLDCAHEPDERTRAIFDRTKQELARHKIGFEFEVFDEDFDEE